ncbi:MAG: helix-turn-helix domain-containing protein [Chloroflexota bacterium]
MAGKRREKLTSTLTTGEVAGTFGVSPGTIRRWCRQGKLRAYRTGPRGARRFRRGDVAVVYLDRAIQKYLKELSRRR